MGGQGSSNFGVVRLNADGTLDTGFGNAGRAVFDIASSYDEGQGLVMQADGKILLTGSSYNLDLS
ncbi:NHL repeat-containing protein [Azorhizophilus paspali]